MNSPTPTPGPWKTFGRTIYAGETPVVLAIAEFDAEVAPTYGNDARYPLKGDDEALANAELIVRAVNSLAALTQQRDALRDACKQLRSYADLKLQGHRQDYPEDHCMVQTALRMIALADKALNAAQ